MDDLISRQAAIDAIWSATPSDELVQGAIEEEIWELPSAEPDRKKGKWIKEDRHAAIYKYCCSECKAYHRAMYDYCPSCGADMRGEWDDD